MQFQNTGMREFFGAAEFDRERKFAHYLLLRAGKGDLLRVWLMVANISMWSITLCWWYCWVSLLVYWLVYWETLLRIAFGCRWKHNVLQQPNDTFVFCFCFSSISGRVGLFLWWWHKGKWVWNQLKDQIQYNMSVKHTWNTESRREQTNKNTIKRKKNQKQKKKKSKAKSNRQQTELLN